MIEEFKQIFMSIKTILPVSSLVVVSVSLVSLWIITFMHIEEFEHPEIPVSFALCSTILTFFWFSNMWF